MIRVQRLVGVMLLAVAAACGDDSPTGDNGNDDNNNNGTPTQLAKSSWQMDLASLRGDYRLEAPIVQSGGTLSGSGRDNNREVDVVTTGSVSGTTITVRFVLTNGGSPRGEFTCTATLAGGSGGTPQTGTGTFTTPDAAQLFGGAAGALGPGSTECTMR